MHRKTRKFSRSIALSVRLSVVALLGIAGLVASTGSANAALPVPFTQKTVKISNAYELAQCSIVVNGTDFNGNETGYLSAQSQANLLGGFVKSTAITCVATNADNAVVDTFTYTGTGPTLLNTRKNGSYGVSSTYNVCIYLTIFDYVGGSSTSSKCSS